MVKPSHCQIEKGESSKSSKISQKRKRKNIEISTSSKENELETEQDFSDSLMSLEVDQHEEDINISEDVDDDDENIEVEEQVDNISEGKKGKRTVPMKKSKNKSDVWPHFHKYTNKFGLKRALCKYCNKSLATDYNKNGTSSLRSHVRSCRKNPENIGRTNTLDAFCTSNGSFRELGSNGWKFNQHDVRKALARMIVVDELPFIFVEHEGFRHFMSVACPQFIIPSRTTITTDILDLYAEQKELMVANFKKTNQRVSLTTDTLTSNQHVTYMVLTAHYLDVDWKLQKVILNFTPISTHKGEDMGRLIEKCLLEWGIDKVFTITVDNAGSNDTAVSYLRKRLVAWKTDLLGGKYLHMRCIAHIANLVVKNGLKHLSIPLTRIRTSVVYMRNSSMRWKKFKDFAVEEKISTQKLLSLDCPTRCNSVLTMLESALMFREVFEKYAFYDVEYKKDFSTAGHYEKIGPPVKGDWELAEKLVVVLRHFYELTLRVSGSKFVTSNVFLDDICDIDALLKKWIGSTDEDISKIADRMQMKFNKYWGNPLKMNMMLYVVVMLDPRFKLDYVIYAIKDMYGAKLGDAIAASAKSAFYEMYDEYKRLYAPSQLEATSMNSSGTSMVDEPPRSARFESFLSQSGEMESFSESEVDAYLSERRMRFEKDFDIIKWWKNKVDLYPILSRMAHDLLAMPISSVASESAFSTGGRVINDFRASLAPTTVQALICTQDWLRNAPILPGEEDYDAIEKLEEDWLGKVSKEFAAISI